MNIYVKYCGGCNPRFDRREAVEELGKRLQANLENIKIQHTDPQADAHLLVVGCERSCLKGLGAKREVILNHQVTLDEVVKQILGWSEEMQDYREEYKDKLVTAKEALKQVKDYDRVAIGHACGEPRALTGALAERMNELKGVETTTMVGMADSAYCFPEAKGHLRHNSLFVGKNERVAIKEGRADYTPRYFSRIPSLFTDGSLPLDVALVQVSAPDKHGYVSFGVSVDYSFTAAKVAKIAIAQINKNMPRCHGDCFMHVSEFDYLVEEDLPMVELASAELSEVEKKIGANCASLIKDGDTLQLGIGALPDAVLLSLKDKKDLGIHSEMFSDGVVELIEAGVITNKKKNYNPGKLVATFLMGSKKLYDFVDDNPAVYMASADYTNDPYVIAKNDNLVSINSCVAVDFMGQVSSESVGTMQISGVGGQVDFVRGANMSKGGRSIIAMSSTAKGGTISKIVPMLEPGVAVTTGRNDVAIIVTEYGIADLRGKSLRERAKALIEIAHPNFREELIGHWEDRFKMKWKDITEE